MEKIKKNVEDINTKVTWIAEVEQELSNAIANLPNRSIKFYSPPAFCKLLGIDEIICESLCALEKLFFIDIDGDKWYYLFSKDFDLQLFIEEVMS